MAGDTIYSRGEEIAEVKLKAAKRILEMREEELMKLVGPCSDPSCRLHFCHAGPCDI